MAADMMTFPDLAAPDRTADPSGDAGTDTAPTLTIVMPCLNECETLSLCLDEAADAFRRIGIAGEIVIADNGSTDGSVEIAAAAKARIVPVTTRGYGAALTGGIRAARAPYVVYADCDGSYDFSEAGHLFEKLKGGADLVMGTRFPAGGGRIHSGAMPWLHRFVGTPALTALFRLLYGVRITDINSGMRGIRVDAFKSLRIVSTGMEFSSEIALQMSRHGFRIDEAPITLRKDGRHRPPHLRTWRDGWRHLCILLLYSPRVLFFLPGAVLAIMGASLLLALAPGVLRLGDVTLATNSRIVASLLTMVGMQILMFGAIAKYVAHIHGMVEARPRFIRLFRGIFQKWAIPAGLLFFLIGASIVAEVFLRWQEANFGHFAEARADRLLAPAATLSVFGIQLVMGAFFVMLLDIGIRE